jgi:hypothetical protein
VGAAFAIKIYVYEWYVACACRDLSLLVVPGTSSSHFASLKHPFDAVRTFNYLRENPDLGMICLNDDEDAASEEQIGTLLHEWLEERWGTTPAWWEREDGEVEGVAVT